MMERWGVRVADDFSVFLKDTAALFHRGWDPIPECSIPFPTPPERATTGIVCSRSG